MRYEVSGGRILTWALEAHVTDHCNLRCADCCTLSPHLSPHRVRPQDLARDLGLAATALRPNLFKLTGGEPLLHPEIVRCAEVARDSGIAPQLSLTTNGLLLARAPDALFAVLDRITVSAYASAPVPPRVLDAAAERCARHGVFLSVKTVDRFQRMDAPAPFHDDAAASSVHATCWLRHRCHMVRDGRFYVCTRPPHLDQRLRSIGRPTDLAAADGVALDAPELVRRLLARLEADEPLAACSYCLGTGGPWEAHRQLPAPAAS